MSMHESCVRAKTEAPVLSCLDRITESLERDAREQRYKYRDTEPSVSAARYHVHLPRSPQNAKFSTRTLPAVPDEPTPVEGRPGELTDEESKSPGNSALSPRYNIRTLRNWFKDIDIAKTGSITRRDLLVALRRHRAMQTLFCTAQGLSISEADGLTGAAAVEKARRDEVARIKQILDTLDTDGSGTMEWTEFVEFFRRSGMFLEYQTRQSLNRCSVMVPTPGIDAERQSLELGVTHKLSVVDVAKDLHSLYGIQEPVHEEVEGEEEEPSSEKDN